ncbi:HesA/MoeB/ThiF family protein [Rheinheimera soli]|uniref:HesA/MoeB/ThiF family protein n=1 Tax=Rheinheimera soli TaxID=443616 RepID=UPI001E650F0A|nr:molybdopterin-synthase adenylyltransferase MoeB [Rheinheimera soli]
MTKKSRDTAELSTTEALRYSRHLMLPAMDFRGQETLLSSRVLVVGMGGLGCAAAPYLVASGIGHITLVDDDLIDRTNLQRQILYRESDVGSLKAQRACMALRELNSEIEIEALCRRLDAEELSKLVGGYSLVLDCTDNLLTRNAINEACFKARVPLVSGAAIRFEGQVVCFNMHDDMPCYQCLSLQFTEQQLTCMEAGILSPVVGVIGAVQALEVVKILASVGSPSFGVLQLFDAFHGQWRQFKLAKDPNCPVCGSNR